MECNRSDYGFLLVDREVVHNMDNMGFTWVFGNGEKPSEIPGNWLSPIDYSKGKIHIRIHVLEKPGDLTVNYLCRLLVKRHSRETLGIVGFRSVFIEKPGVYFFEESVENIHKMTSPSEFDLKLPVVEMQLVAADIYGQSIHSKWETDMGEYRGYPEINRYFPLRVRYTAFVVPENNIFSGFTD